MEDKKLVRFAINKELYTEFKSLMHSLNTTPSEEVERFIKMQVSQYKLSFSEENHEEIEKITFEQLKKIKKGENK